MPSKEQKQEWAKDKAASVGNLIVEQFKSGDLPEVVAPIFLNAGQRQADRYTGWTNQLLVALSGHSDAATYKQWIERGRVVRKGEKLNCHIFRPMTFKKTDKATGDEKSFTKFTIFGVFGIEQTDIADDEKWAKFAPDDTKIRDILASLPMREVADVWGLSVAAYTGKAGKALGWYAPGKNAIAVGVEDVATWAHELIHAADDRNGSLKKSRRCDEDYADGEIVAELGGCILLTVLGYDRGADRGGAFKYVTAWSKGKNPVSACKRMLDRACNAVALILQTAKELDGVTVAEPTEELVAA